MSADVDYMDTCKVSGPQKEVVFYTGMKDGEVCDVCNNLYRILELLHEKDDENLMKCGNNGKN